MLHDSRRSSRRRLGPTRPIQKPLTARGFVSAALRLVVRAGDRALPRQGRRAPLRLEQTGYRFSESTLFERIALHDATIDGAADGPRRLREALLGQTAPVIEALHAWSRMTRAGLWGQVTSSWGAQFLTMAARLRGEAPA